MKIYLTYIAANSTRKTNRIFPIWSFYLPTGLNKLISLNRSCQQWLQVVSVLVATNSFDSRSMRCSKDAKPTMPSGSRMSSQVKPSLLMNSVRRLLVYRWSQHSCWWTSGRETRRRLSSTSMKHWQLHSRRWFPAVQKHRWRDCTQCWRRNGALTSQRRK